MWEYPHVFAIGGTLKSLEPELKNLMAFGTDDEKALVGGFNETLEELLICFAKSTFAKT